MEGGREGARRDVLPILHLRRARLPKAGLPLPAREPRRELDRQRGRDQEEGGGGRGRRKRRPEKEELSGGAGGAGGSSSGRPREPTPCDGCGEVTARCWKTYVFAASIPSLLCGYRSFEDADPAHCWRYHLFVWLISHQSTVLFSKNKSATNNHPTLSQNKSTPAIVLVLVFVVHHTSPQPNRPPPPPPRSSSSAAAAAETPAGAR
jgi:hypothetical protein